MDDRRKRHISEIIKERNIEIVGADPVTRFGFTRELDTSTAMSGPHVFAVRFNAVRYRHIRVHRIPPRVRDDREPPLE